MRKLNIPVGISDFEKIRNGGFYYIDKSGLITEILNEKAEVTLITRPVSYTHLTLPTIVHV